jgi:hypothetical protein
VLLLNGTLSVSIDALDECREGDRDQLIEAITKIYNRSTPTRKLKFLLTSRPYEGIRRAIDGGLIIQGLGFIYKAILVPWPIKLRKRSHS